MKFKFKLKNKQEIIRYIKSRYQVIENALLYRLEFLVTELQNHAKASGAYQDQTSNLRSSIGGVVVKNGKVIEYRGFEGTQEGSSTGLEFINSIIGEMGSGYRIILVAGMNYASYVEEYHGKNVLKATELKAQQDIQVLMKELKLEING